MDSISRIRGFGIPTAGRGGPGDQGLTAALSTDGIVRLPGRTRSAETRAAATEKLSDDVLAIALEPPASGPTPRPSTWGISAPTGSWPSKA